MNPWRLGAHWRRGAAAVLLAISWFAWLHYWSPLVLLGAGVVWVVVQRRADNGEGQRLHRVWRRVWPPDPTVLLVLMGVGAITFILNEGPRVPKVMPLALHALALSVLVLGAWWRALLVLPISLGGDRAKPRIDGERAARPAP